MESSRRVSNLFGFTSVDSVYNVPVIDPMYKVGNMQYSGVADNAMEFVTTAASEPGFWEDPFAWRDRKIDEWLGNDSGESGKEQNETPMEKPPTPIEDDKRAIIFLGIIGIGYFAWRKYK